MVINSNRYWLMLGGSLHSSAGIIGGLQALNLLTVIMLALALSNDQAKINTYLVVGLFLFFQIHTYIRYIYSDKNSAKIIEEKWLSRTELYREKFITIQYVYISLSVLSCFGIAIYLGAQKTI